jgi:hypothetical protein
LTHPGGSVRLAAMQKITYLIFPILLGLLAVHASAQTTYKCKGADGTVQFSDRPCKGGVPVRVKTQPDSPERKAESDARIQRDKALASHVESSNLAREQAARAAQDQQQQTNQGVANTVEQGRTQQRANTKSVNPGTAVPERTN